MAKAVITNVSDLKLSKILNADYGIAKISYASPFKSKINDVMPFRVKFINVGIEGYGPNNPAPIGIAIIGVNNYIL